MFNLRPLILFLLALALLPAFARSARAEDDLRSRGVALLEQYGDSVVGVSAVMKIQMGGSGASRAQEQKIDGIGTMIHPAGLTVVSNSAIDPISMMRSMRLMGMPNQALDSKTEYSDVKLRLADGTEKPAKLVLKDPDLDLAFILPEAEEGVVYPHIDLKDGGSADLLERLISIGRLGKNLDRAGYLELHRVASVVKKPRTFYVVSNAPGPGLPAFTIGGKVLGISLIRKGNAGGGGTMQVILPAADVLEIAEQALEPAE